MNKATQKPIPFVPDCTWRNDCGGKKDYDGPLLRVSSRMWPRGGGFIIFDDDGREQAPDMTIWPSAISSIIFCSGKDQDIKVAEARFTGETDIEVQVQVERWVQGEFERIYACIRREYPSGKNTLEASRV